MNFFFYKYYPLVSYVKDQNVSHQNPDKGQANDNWQIFMIL